MELLRLGRWRRRDRFAVELRCPTATLGNPGARWTYCPEDLTNGAVVYTFGVGCDLSFERALLERHPVEIHAFDFTPRAREWVEAQTLPAWLTFHPWGISDRDGEETFYPPLDPTHVSHAVVPRGAAPGGARRFPVKRLLTILGELGHRRLALLKLDVEGCEFRVIEDVLRSGVEVDQILVEFHHRFPEIGIAATRETLTRLNAHGYRVFAISPDRTELSLRRR